MLRFLFTHHSFLLTTATLALLAGCATRPTNTSTSAAADLVYIGTNVAGAQDNTIFLYRLDPATGALKLLSAQKGGASPTYLALDTSHQHMYAVSETQVYQGEAGGGVSALTIDQHTGGLTMLNQQPSRGASPCYISLDHTGKTVLVANYLGGNVSQYLLEGNGQLSPPTAMDQHVGRGPHKNQNTAHAHCIIPDPANHFAFAVDLGTDQVYGYRLDAAQGHLERLPEPAFQARPGAGPRHLVFHPNGQRAYLINELNSTLTALSYNANAGRFTEIQTLSALPADYKGENSGADVHLSADGRFLYASNRGHNSIGVFAINKTTGILTPVQDISTQGKTPRNFSLDRSGRLLLVANQNSDNVVTYRVDAATGKLTPTGQTITVPSPMFVQVVEDFRR